MDAVAFPPPPAPFLDDDFCDFTFASAPPPNPPPSQPAAFDDDWGDFVASPLGSNPDGSAPATPSPTATSSSAWEKPRGPLPLSLFGADDKEEEEGEEEGLAATPPTATANQWTPSFTSIESKPADLKDLIAGLYGSQPLRTPGTSEAATPEGPSEDDDGFEDDGWEFKTAPSSARAEDGVRQAHGNGIQDMPKSMESDQEDWSLFTTVDNKLNHVQTIAHVGTHEFTGQVGEALSYSPANDSSILDLYKESELVHAVHVPQCCSESVLSSSDLFSNNEMNSSLGADDHSIISTNDSILIDFYNKLRKESLTMISQKRSTFSDENNTMNAIEREIQEILEKLQDSIPKGFRMEEHPLRDVCIAELLNSTKEERITDFEQQYLLEEKIVLAQEDLRLAVELYKHSVSTLHTLKLASKKDQCDYVGAWYSMLLSCAHELQHATMLWQEACHVNVCDLVISEGAYCFIALGEIYRVAQILYLSLQYFKPWVLASPGTLSKMMACWDSCTNAWTDLETALRMVVDSNHSDASNAKALLESTININEKLEVSNIQKVLPNNEMTCRLTLLPASLVQEMKMVTWNGDHYLVKVANLWANRISCNPPQFSLARVSSMHS